MNPIQWMSETYDRYKDLKVCLIAIPLPPVHVRGLIYRTDSFSSKTFDMGFELNDKMSVADTYRAASIAPSQFGPAVLLTLKVNSLIGFDQNGFLVVHRSSCCATVSYAVRHSLKDGTGNRWDYADYVTLDNINFSRSCNPGSHISVPKAPYLTSLLQYASAPDGGRHGGHEVLKDFVYLSPDQAEALFPDWDFSANAGIDHWLSMCATQPKVRFTNSMVGLGDWTVPYLRQLRTNPLRMEEPGYGENRLTLVDH